MWMRAKVAGPGTAAPVILGLACFSLVAACGRLATAQTPNQARQRILQIQQEIFQKRQIHSLTRQINQLQLQAINLSMQIAELCRQNQVDTPAAEQVAPQPVNQPEESPELQAADARNVCDSLKQELLSALHESAAYKQAKAALESAQADLERARAAATSPRDDDVVALAYKVLADQTVITRLERQALDDSAAWKAANLRLQEANRSLAAIRTNPDQAGNGNPDLPPIQAPGNDQGPGVQIRYLAALRDRANAQAHALMQQLAAISPYDAQVLAQEGEAMREELVQLRRQRQQQANGQWTPGGAPVIQFSPQISPQVQQFLQERLNEIQRTQNPADAAEKARERWEEAEQQQQQQQRDPQQAQQTQDQATQAQNQREADRLQYEEEKRRRQEENERALRQSLEPADRK